MNMSLNEHENLYEAFEKTAIAHAKQVVFKQVVDHQLCVTTYSTLMEKITNAREKLALLLLKPGCRIGIVAASSPEWLIAYFSGLALELTIVCIDPALAQDQIFELVKNADVHVLLTEDSIFSQWDIKKYQALCVLNIKQQFNVLYQPQHLIQAYNDECDPSIASILFTSGTSGGFKGVLLEHQALLYAAYLCIKTGQATQDDNVLCLLPAHHVYTLVCVILGAVLVGGSITFIDKLEGPHILEAMKVAKPSLLIGVPRIYELFTGKILSELNKKGALIGFLGQHLIHACAFIRKWTHCNIGQFIFTRATDTFGGRMRLLISGAAPLAPDIFNMLYGLGLTVLEGYGLTETCASVVLNPLTRQKSGSVGVIMQGVEINIYAKDADDIGEICFRSPTLMRGYLHDPDSTEQAFRDGWYHTGDLGKLDADGFLYIKGRIKELIVLSNGKKISPNFVDSFLTKIPHADSIAAVGVPDRHAYSEQIYIAVVMDETAVAHFGREVCEESIKEDIAKRQLKMPKWCRFSKILFVQKIPKTNTLKVKRNELLKIIQQDVSNIKNKEVELDYDEEDNSELENKIIKYIIELSPNLNKKSLSAKSSLQFDAALDSIDMRGLVAKIEEEQKVALDYEQLTNVFKIKDLAHLISISKSAKGQGKSSGSILLQGAALEKIRQSFINLIDYRGLKKRCFEGTSMIIKKIFLNYFEYEVVGLENISQQASYMICANHSSHLDNMSLAIALDKCGLPCVAAAAKDYFFDRKLMSFFMRTIFKIFPFDREMGYAALQKNVAYMQMCKEYHFPVILFPEGTRSVSGEMGPFKNGVALFSDLLDMSILPAYIEGTHQSLPKGKLIPKRGKIKVIIGKPIDIKQYFNDNVFDAQQKKSFNTADYHAFMNILKNNILSLRTIDK